MARGKSRTVRWGEACADARQALDSLRSALEELNGVKDEYSDWQSNLPENLQQSPTAEKLEAVCDLDFDPDTVLSDIEDVLSEAEGIDLPKGFGRD